MISRLSIFLLPLFFPLLSFAQIGTLKGTVIDADTKETLVGTTVVIQGTTIGTITDFDGNFIMEKVKPGSYNIIVSYISYDTQITRVLIENGETAILNIQLKAATLDIGEIKVVGKKRENTEVSLLTSLKANDLIVSGISAQQISRSQDKDAAEVIKRVPGITITDGRFVIVRGLIERYNSVMLNNATAPSFEADKRAFSFDAIPSGMINNILIYKSPAPELPADFAGAAINVETKSSADENSLVISYSTKYVENTTFSNSFISHKGGTTDWLGYDNGSRNIPEEVPNSSVFKNLYNWESVESYMQKTDELEKVSKLFKNNWGTSQQTPAPDQNFSLTFQHRFVLGKISIGNISSLNYSSSSDLLSIDRLEYQDYSPEQNLVIKDFDFKDSRSKESHKLGLIHNWNILYGKNQKLELRNFLNQTGNKSTSIREGVNYYNVETLRLFDLKFESRFVYSGQIAGVQHFNQEKTKLSWMAGYSITSNKQPDNRRLTFVLDENDQSQMYNKYYLRIQNVPNAYMGGRLWLNMKENIFDYKADLEHRFRLFNSKLDYIFKSGIFYQKKNRSFDSRLIGAVALNNPPDVLYNPVEEIFTEENIYLDRTLPLNQHGFTYRDNTSASDNYKAFDELLAGYVGIKIPFTPKINIYGGVRVEKFNRKISDFYELTGNTEGLDILRDTINYFPSVNLTYNLNEKNLFRLSYGKTVNRPEFREMSNFAYQDFEMFVMVHGNDQLQNAYINNFDFRYEWYPANGEIVSVAAFYKGFTNPIEAFLIPAGTGYDYKPYNTEEGYSMGIELDMRKKLIDLENSSSFLHYLKDLTVIFNTSIIKSEINTEKQGFAREKKRIMQGQSPFILNLGLNYQPETSGLMVGLNYNIIGKRIVYVGTPTNPHTWELPRNSLDLTVEKLIGKRITIKAGIKDIINNPLRFVQYYGTNDEIEVNTYTYKPNRNVSVGIIVRL